MGLFTFRYFFPDDSFNLSRREVEDHLPFHILAQYGIKVLSSYVYEHGVLYFFFLLLGSELVLL